MVLYTVMPLEVVFDASWSDTRQDNLCESTYLGRSVLVRVSADGTRHVVRLMSSDPSDYLDPRFFPGTMLTG